MPQSTSIKRWPFFNEQRAQAPVAAVAFIGGVGLGPEGLGDHAKHGAAIELEKSVRNGVNQHMRKVSAARASVCNFGAQPVPTRCPKMQPCNAISPIDGRYRRHAEPLAAYFSEAGLIQYRIRVEVEYFIALHGLGLAAASSVVRRSGGRSARPSMSASSGRCPGSQGNREDHQPRRQSRGILHQGPVGLPRASQTGRNLCTSA